MFGDGIRSPAKRLRRTCAAAIAVCAIVVSSVGGAEASLCAGEADRVVLDTRVLQTDLMVAALRCNEKARYAAFVERFSPPLAVGPSPVGVAGLGSGRLTGNLG